MSISASHNLVDSAAADASLHLVDPNPTSVAGETMAANSEETLPPNAFDHMLKYHWFKKSYNWVAGCKYVSLVANKTAPTVNAVMSFKPISYSANLVNTICDYKLTQVDRVVDLTAVQIDDMTRSVRGALGTVELIAVKGVYEPTIRKVDAVGSKVHSLLHNEKGQAIVPSIADPIVSPVNVVLEKGVKKLAPEKETVEKQSSELKRTYKIIGSAFSKSKVPQTAIETEEPSLQIDEEEPQQCSPTIQ